jgi:hypothetical protein
LIEETLCAKKALATNFESSEDQTLVVKIFSLGIQLAYISTNASMASFPSLLSSPPIKTRSGLSKS